MSLKSLFEKKRKRKELFLVSYKIVDDMTGTYKVIFFIYAYSNWLWITLDLLFGYTDAQVSKLGFQLCSFKGSVYVHGRGGL